MKVIDMPEALKWEALSMYQLPYLRNLFLM